MNEDWQSGQFMELLGNGKSHPGTRAGGRYNRDR